MNEDETDYDPYMSEEYVDLNQSGSQSGVNCSSTASSTQNLGNVAQLKESSEMPRPIQGKKIFEGVEGN